MGAIEAHAAILGADAARGPGAILARKRALAGFLRARKRVQSVSGALGALLLEPLRGAIPPSSTTDRFNNGCSRGIDAAIADLRLSLVQRRSRAISKPTADYGCAGIHWATCPPRPGSGG